MIFLALALTTGTLAVYDNGQALFSAPVHGTGAARDCGSHTFLRDDGERITVVITCDKVRQR